MTAFDVKARQTVLRAPLKELADTARAERATLTYSSPAWEFFRGVEEAANGALYPNHLLARAEHWLDLEAPSFRDGYLAATANLEAAITSATPPVRIPLPRFEG